MSKPSKGLHLIVTGGLLVAAIACLATGDSTGAYLALILAGVARIEFAIENRSTK